MKIITISREFGSGGRELGKRLADILGCDYYDSEIIYAVAQKSGFDKKYVENVLDNHGWQKFPVTFGGTISSYPYLNSIGVELLLEQKKVIEEIAALGKDCVIVGRNADVLLSEYNPFSIFVCADTDSKVKRCRERAPEGEELTDKELAKKLRQIDKRRAQTRAILSGSEWGQRDVYHLTVNTTGWNIRELAPAVAEFASRWFGRTE